ncbi:MAG: YbbR-like domain-containing protein [Aminipila sp.]
MLQNKNFTKLLSVVLAIFLWVYVVAVENPPTKVKIPNVPIKLVNVESLNQRGLAISSDEDYFMDIVIEGTRSDVLKISADDIIATADVFGYGVGENYIPVTVTLPDSVSVADQKTTRLTIDIEELVSVYKPVNVVFNGKIDPKLEATVFSMTPEEVEVKGAKSKVASVKSVNAAIDVSELTNKAKVFTTDLSTVDAKGQSVNNIKLSSDTADIEAAVYQIKEVPLEVDVSGEVDKAYQVTSMNVPQKVKIKGLKEDLDKINKVTADPIDISKVTATTEIPLSVKLPKGIMLAQESEKAAVSIDIKGISVKEFEIPSSSISALGLGEKLSLVINTQSVKVKISGKETDVEKLTAEDIGLSIDLTGLQAGIYTVPLKIDKEDGVSEILVTPSEIHITINEAV